jgi:hypothetical protein
MVQMATYQATLAWSGGKSGWPSLLPCRGHEYTQKTARRGEEFARLQIRPGCEKSRADSIPFPFPPFSLVNLVPKLCLGTHRR